jgi:Mg2+ and Co2+ transporter CorA
MLNVCPSAATLHLADAMWIDLVDPTDEERAQVERTTNIHLPCSRTVSS